jgi:hypothetical protein
MKCLDEPRVVRFVSKRRPKPLHGGVQAVLEIDKRSVRPEPLPQLFAGDDVPRPFEHHDENLERLILQPDANASLSQLARPEIDFKSRETPDV